MKKINVEATKLNNEDVIATSGSCPGNNTYHLMVCYPNINGVGNVNEACYLYPTGSMSGAINASQKGSLPTDISSSFTSQESTSWYLDLGNPNQGDTYYWGGSSWIKCTDKHSK